MFIKNAWYVVMCAEITGDFYLGDSRWWIFKSSTLFDLEANQWWSDFKQRKIDCICKIQGWFKAVKIAVRIKY